MEVVESWDRHLDEVASQHTHSCGKQVASVRETKPAWSFGGDSREFDWAVTRTSLQKRGASGETAEPIWAACHDGSKLPGPGTYDPVTPLLMPLIGFPKSRRFTPEPQEVTEEDETQSKMSILFKAHKEALGISERPQPMAVANKVKYPKGPSYAFGSSSLGSRLPDGWNFSKQAPVKTHSRKTSWQELRDSLPDPW